MARLGFIIALLVIIGTLSLISVNFVHLAGDNFFINDQAGFFNGLVHGILAPITLILGLFTKIRMYELNNIGWWYNFGFLIGLLAIWAGGKSTQNITKNYYYGYNKPNQGLSKESIEDLVDKKIESKLNFKKGKNKEKKRNWMFWKK